MIAVDTNILVYAHRRDSAWNRRAADVLVSLAEGKSAWAIPWPCLHEFLAIVTHPRIYLPPTPLEYALDQIEAWLESPSVVLLAEMADYWNTLRNIMQKSSASGPLVHDARVAAICVHHSVTELWTADRDFGRFPALTTKNPLVD